MVLSAANAIFFGAVLSEFAKEINRYACTKLTAADFVQMAFYYSCRVETHPGRVIKMRDAEARVRIYLAERYLFDKASGVGDVTAILKSVVADSGSKDVARSTFWKIALLRHKELEAFVQGTLPPNRPKPKKKKKRSGGKASAKGT